MKTSLKRGFGVTWEIVTDESAACGDVARRGTSGVNATLREALETVRMTLPNDAGIASIEPNDSDVNAARWVTYFCGRGSRSGSFTSVSLHFPRDLSPSSRARVARFLGAR